MSAPKRGMVAGQPIQTQAQSAEYDAGYERIFGKGTKERGRFVYRDGVLVNVHADWTDAERRAQTSTEELQYSNLRSSEGVDISSRRKRREYMKAAGVTDSGDYSADWYAKKRRDIERNTDNQRRADIIEAHRSMRRY